MQDETWLPQPDTADIDISTVLRALADPMRLRIVRELHAAGELTCSAIDMPVKVSTVSHHLAELRLAGVVSTRLAGNSRPSRLRFDDLEQRFPGLMAAIVMVDDN